MAVLSDYVSGTITLTNGSNAFTGTGTGWLAASFREGDTILGIESNAGVEYVIASITGNGSGTLTQNWEGATGTYTYRMRYLPDGARVPAQAAQLVELLGNGNLQALAGLTGPGVPVFNGPHAMTIKPEADFVNGVAYDVQVDTLADRDAYDGQSEGFAVLVADVGDGRSALYSKNSNTVGDWSDPAYVTGPVGPLPDVEATVDTLPPGSTPTVTPTPITGGVRLDFELPEASGFYNAGVYNIAYPYNQDDVVQFNGSSFIALQSVPTGEAPSGASPPVDTAYWQVLAAKGEDGAGTGNVVGPASAVDDRIAVFDGTTGELIKDSGVSANKILRVDQVQAFSFIEQGQGRANIGADVLAGFRNKLINGDFDVWQRATTQNSSGIKSSDRWNVYGSGAWTFSRVLVAVDAFLNAPTYSGFLNVTSAATVGDESTIQQRIEKVRQFHNRRITIRAMIWPTAAITTTIKLFTVYDTGTPGAFDAVTPKSQTLVANTWNEINLTFDIPSLVGKTIHETNSCLQVAFTFPAGSTYGVYFTHASLVEGDATAEADPFSPRHIQQELALCQRYYEDGRVQMTAYQSGVTGFGYFTPFLIEKRATPTITFSGTTYLNASGIVASSLVEAGFRVGAVATSLGPVSFSADYQADAEL